MKIVILAGGSGSRLWPMSRSDIPKQFCRLTSEKTMLEETLDRFKDYPADKKFIATTASLAEKVKEILPDFPLENIIIEPERRDTAPAMGFNALKLSLLDPDEPMAFIPSDHYIARVDDFLKSIATAEEVIKQTGKLLDIAIFPTEPNTALGYTKIGQLLEEKNGVKFYEFLGHTEKPDFKTAQKYLKSGNYLWHANYYMWTPRKFLEAYEKYTPQTFTILQAIKEELQGKNRPEKIRELYGQMEKISIDYAITEKIDPKDMLIIKGEFGWKDIGTWDTLHENLLSQADERRNLTKGECLNLDTSGSLIYGRRGKIIATIGVDDLVIVDTDNALLVCPKARAQEVKEIIKELKKKDEKYI